MVASDFEKGRRFKNKELGDICEVIELEDGTKLFESEYGRWRYLDEDLFVEA